MRYPSSKRACPPNEAFSRKLSLEAAKLHARFWGRYEEAVRLLEETLSIRKRVLGPEHQEFAPINTVPQIH